jgi:hypothetical protein
MLSFSVGLSTFSVPIVSIVHRGSKEQMSWIHTGRIIAAVKNTHSVWNGTYVGFIDYTVNSCLSSIISDISISRSVLSASPDPAVSEALCAQVSVAMAAFDAL